MIKLKILTGSTRPGRFNIQPATWITEIAKKRTDISVEMIDVQELNLPFLDESMPPLMHQYSKDHTKAWSKQVEEADAFIFVTPEYNHSYSPALKNALDYLYHEWTYKPVAYVSYGSLAGGSRAVEHLRGIAGEMKMFDLKEQILLPNYWGNMSSEGQYQFTADQEKEAVAMIDSLVFWAEQMKTARSKMKKQ